ncbi:alpha/beta hydrolase [Nocardioides houyundeii]|uniref:alpha/beta hydrolase n=1 Tax=Nocardioides houyundeii TaxID=2045452 RepID=UPI000DF354F9|nr:alpha/beta hydrolase [Nocardioides houyundeii]
MSAGERVPDAWDEPTGAVPRGTLIVVPGRGEGAAQYQRFGRRIAAESWKVRLVALDLDDTEGSRTVLEKLVADESLPAPKVLLGADTGASWVGRVADDVHADAAIIAGAASAASASSAGVDDWAAELDARSACPVHRGVLEGDSSFERGALNLPLPCEWEAPVVPTQPTLVLHGDADTVTALDEAVAPYAGVPHAVVKVVHGGRHDVLNDATHRAVAATIVLFLESLRLGRDLPAIVSELALDGVPA